MKTDLRIVTWNCQGAFRKKYHLLDRFDADVLIVQECEDPARSQGDHHEWSSEYLWIGDNKNKGLGVFSKKTNKLEKLHWYGEVELSGSCGKIWNASWSTSDVKLFLPFKVNDEMTILAVWTKNAEAFWYIGQFWKYLQIHKEDIADSNCIMCGDFNSHPKFDKKSRWWNHTDVVQQLGKMGFRSLYHHQNSISPGEEQQNTFFMYRRPEKGFHIDYAFLPESLIRQSNLLICNPTEWMNCSDHVPLVIDVLSGEIQSK